MHDGGAVTAEAFLGVERSLLGRRWRALGALTKRVKESFDPKGVLNPGRMWAGV